MIPFAISFLFLLCLSTLSLGHGQNQPRHPIPRINLAERPVHIPVLNGYPSQQSLIARKRNALPADMYPRAHPLRYRDFPQRMPSYPRNVIPRYAEAEAEAEPAMPNISIPKGDRIVKNTLKCNKKNVCSGTIDIQS